MIITMLEVLGIELLIALTTWGLIVIKCRDYRHFIK